MGKEDIDNRLQSGRGHQSSILLRSNRRRNNALSHPVPRYHSTNFALVDAGARRESHVALDVGDVGVGFLVLLALPTAWLWRDILDRGRRPGDALTIAAGGRWSASGALLSPKCD
ncbi:MAG: hypothetical protein HQL40_06805 [Alphaproteobacteria bacterium]|nr:hypothetical protein [Alphaproteobacteria bacterium]